MGAVPHENACHNKVMNDDYWVLIRRSTPTGYQLEELTAVMRAMLGLWHSEDGIAKIGTRARVRDT